METENGDIVEREWREENVGAQFYTKSAKE